LLEVAGAATTLDQQYRMVEGICQVASRVFYKGILKTADALRERDHPPWCNFEPWCRPVLFFNCAAGEEKEGSSFKNALEAQAVVQVINAVALKSQMPMGGRIAVITPYKAQIPCIEKALTRAFGPTTGVRVQTVDSYQGQEREMIVLSCVRNSGLGFLTDHQRLNVAITRARFSLVVIGDYRLLTQNRTWNAVLSEAHHLDHLPALEETALVSKLLKEQSRGNPGRGGGPRQGLLASPPGNASPGMASPGQESERLVEDEEARKRGVAVPSHRSQARDVRLGAGLERGELREPQPSGGSIASKGQGSAAVLRWPEPRTDGPSRHGRNHNDGGRGHPTRRPEDVPPARREASHAARPDPRSRPRPDSMHRNVEERNERHRRRENPPSGHLQRQPVASSEPTAKRPRMEAATGGVPGSRPWGAFAPGAPPPVVGGGARQLRENDPRRPLLEHHQQQQMAQIQQRDSTAVGGLPAPSATAGGCLVLQFANSGGSQSSFREPLVPSEPLAGVARTVPAPLVGRPNAGPMYSQPPPSVRPA
jgi:hypothetical protein